MSTNKKVRVAIAGAGIAGLSLFQVLRSMDKANKMDVTIYESSKVLPDIGVGILLSPRSLQILREVGLGDQIAAILPEDVNSWTTHIVARKGDQPEGFHVHENKLKGFGGRFLRSELRDALCSYLTNELHLDHKLVSYKERNDEIALYFDNGVTASCDFLVGADGIRSAVRRCFLEEQGLPHSPSKNPVWTGAYIYRELISAEDLQAEYPGHRVFEAPVTYLGKSKQVVAYRVSRAGPVNVAAINSDPSKEGTAFDGPIAVACSRDETLSLFQGWEPEAMALLKCLKQPTKWVIEALPPLSSFANGRVALVGDAAHAMTPYQASGGNQAIEDSYILASLLSSPNCTKATISKVSEVYDAIRRGPANQATEISRIAGRLFHLRGPGFEDVVEGDTSVTVDRMKVIFAEIGKMWAPLMKESLEECRGRALAVLRERCAKN